MRPSQLMARKLGQTRMAVVAAPAYLASGCAAKRPTIWTPQLHRLNFARHVDEWSFVVDGTHVSLREH
jgi:hypothetical protein